MAPAGWRGSSRSGITTGARCFKFAGMDSISDAEKLGGRRYIWFREAERAQAGEGEYSHADLIGCPWCGRRYGSACGRGRGAWKIRQRAVA